MRVLVPGGAGFIGSAFVRYLMSETGYRVRVLDKLTYAGNLGNFPERHWKDRRFQFIKGDIRRRSVVRDALKGVDAVVNFAAETHIDRSVVDVDPFVMTDFVGTYILLDEFRHCPRGRFVQISTCEIYGTARKVPMAEDHPLMPQSPYSATKAGADRMCHAYVETYGLPVVVLRPFNMYGPHQYPEKLIPFFFTQALEGRLLPVYGTGRNTRDWTYVEDFCSFVHKVLKAKTGTVAGEVFNVGSGEERNALQIASSVLRYTGKPKSLLRHTADRPGHVRRLVCDTRKAMRVLGWRSNTSFDDGLRKTLNWYSDNRAWWQRIRRLKAYREFYDKWYKKTLGKKGPQ